MDEARFVLKCFVFSALLLVLTQLKTKTGTIESDIQAKLISSETAELVNKVADGGVKAIKDFGIYMRTKISSSIQAAPSKEAVQRKAEAVTEKVEAITVDTKKAIQKIEASVKSAASAAGNEIEEIEEIE